MFVIIFHIWIFLSLGIWELFVWRAALCLTHSKEVNICKIVDFFRSFLSESWTVSDGICLNRPSENMLIRANTDGTYSANWTPGAVGLYTIHVTIDGIEIGMSLFDIFCHISISLEPLDDRVQAFKADGKLTLC